MMISTRGRYALRVMLDMALHGAVWSGGSFVYVPKGVHLSIPLQSYFRLNAKGAGQFEHTLIIVDEGASLHFIEGCSAPKYNVANLHAGCVELYVKKGAKLRYSTIENWSKNMYNLNTKRALVEEGGIIEWVSGSFGSHVGCLYPMSILKGDNSRMEFTGVTFAGAGQDLDTGAKVVQVGKNTSSYMNTRSISKSGVSTFRSSVGDGCAISQASADIMLGMIVGKQKDAALKLGETFLKMIQGEATEEEIDSLEEASALRDIAHMPARVKCAVLGWRTLKEALQTK